MPQKKGLNVFTGAYDNEFLVFPFPRSISLLYLSSPNVLKTGLAIEFQHFWSLCRCSITSF
uniref:Uncharacterized protein n=1 Tax=Rhizophora mucronata TaxID=61149 RepID=A0A2P2LMU5_RHIMU